MRSITIIAVVFAMLSAQMPVTIRGQEAVEQQEEQVDYYFEGQMAAEEYTGDNAFMGGFASGLLLGVIGWGIGYAIISGSTVEVPSHYLRGLERVDRRDFQDGYKAVAMKEKKSKFSGGAGMGTLISVILYLFVFSE